MYSEREVAVMRVLGRLTCLVVISSSTMTCLAQAQPSSSAPVAQAESAESSSPAPGPLPIDLVDPWRDQPLAAIPAPAQEPLPQREIVLVDPWTGGERTVQQSFEMIEVIDPWQSGQPRRIPTAAFPLVDPWR